MAKEKEITSQRKEKRHKRQAERRNPVIPSVLTLELTTVKVNIFKNIWRHPSEQTCALS